MATVILVIHLMVAAAMVAVVLLQRSEGGALGIGGGSGGLMTGRGAANLLTRTTAILAALFFITSISLTIISNGDRAGNTSILDRIGGQQTGTQSKTEDKPSEVENLLKSNEKSTGPKVPESR